METSESESVEESETTTSEEVIETKNKKSKKKIEEEEEESSEEIKIEEDESSGEDSSEMKKKHKQKGRKKKKGKKKKKKRKKKKKQKKRKKKKVENNQKSEELIEIVEKNEENNDDDNDEDSSESRNLEEIELEEVVKTVMSFDTSKPVEYFLQKNVKPILTPFTVAHEDPVEVYRKRPVTHISNTTTFKRFLLFCGACEAIKFVFSLVISSFFCAFSLILCPVFWGSITSIFFILGLFTCVLTVLFSFSIQFFFVAPLTLLSGGIGALCSLPILVITLSPLILAMGCCALAIPSFFFIFLCAPAGVLLGVFPCIIPNPSVLVLLTPCLLNRSGD